MTKIRSVAIFLFVLFFLIFAPVVRAENEVNVYFFWGEGCPHCAKEKKLLDYYQNKYPYIKIWDFELYGNASNSQNLIKVTDILGIRIEGVPLTVIGDQHFSGYSEKISPDKISERIEFCHEYPCPDSLSGIFGTGSDAAIANDGDGQNQKNPAFLNGGVESEMFLNIPLLGKIDARDFSLPILTIFMGALDGFNPCAMWTLLFLISLLLGMKDRKRMWILGSAFIVASASVYFLFMSAWLNLILFLGFVAWIRILIGVLALAGGGYSIKEFIFNKNTGCKVVGDQKRRKTFDRMKLAVQQNSLWLALGGIIILAFAVNLVELICSAGLPAVYAQVLALNEMAGWHYYLYILLYIFFFMLDDLFIFFIAMITLEMTGITTKYARMSRLVGGLVMLIIGLLLIFKPGWLMFG